MKLPIAALLCSLFLLPLALPAAQTIHPKHRKVAKHRVKKHRNH
jgi:hypothetical protein